MVVSSVVVGVTEVEQVVIENRSCHTICVERASVEYHTESKLEWYHGGCVVDQNEHDE